MELSSSATTWRCSPWCVREYGGEALGQGVSYSERDRVKVRFHGSHYFGLKIALQCQLLAAVVQGQEENPLVLADGGHR